MISLKQAILDEIYPSLKVSDLRVVERIIRSVFGKDNSDTNINKQEDCAENCLNQLNIHQPVLHTSTMPYLLNLHCRDGTQASMETLSLVTKLLRLNTYVKRDIES